MQMACSCGLLVYDVHAEYRTFLLLMIGDIVGCETNKVQGVRLS